MGWKLKGAAVFVALVFLAAGVWPVFLIIMALVIIPALFRRSGSYSGSGPYGSSSGGRASAVSRFPYRQAAGVFLLFLSFIAFLSGGTLSPYVFGGLGVLLLAWGRLSLPTVGHGLKPVRDSILLKGSPLPFSWTALIEVKPITRDLGKALSGIREELLLTTSGTPAIHVAVTRFALGERSANEAILKEVERIGRGVVPLGVYLLPVDSQDASLLLSRPIEKEDVPQDAWALALSTGAYDLLSLRSARGFAHAIGLYRRTAPAEGKLGEAQVPPAHTRLKRPPLLWEVFKSMEGRVQWPNPDRYTTFLSSIFATSYESLGSNIIDAGTPSPTSEHVIVKSHSSPPVTLTRAQLRAIMAIYSQGPPVVENRPQPQPQQPQPMPTQTQEETNVDMPQEMMSSEQMG